MSQIAPFRDYKYQSDDILRVKAAFEQLKNEERTGYFVGAFTGIASTRLYRNYFSSFYPLGFFGFVTGVTAMNLYTHQSR